MEKAITGISVYKGTMLQQHEDFHKVFPVFLEKYRPSRILEIGTGAGGFTHFLRDTLNELGMQDVSIKSYDINHNPYHDKLNEMENLTISSENLFGHGNDYILVKQDIIVPYIQSEGRTLVVCDGGNKVKEFNQISEYLKPGDIIMAHDYCSDLQNFQENYYDKIWNWCEINDNDIKEACEKYNLESIEKDSFDKIVWVCKIKK